jgi:hypothetical protein
LVLSLAAIQKQPFPLPHYCGIRYLPSNALVFPDRFLHLYHVHIGHWRFSLTGVITITYVHSTVFRFSTPPSDISMWATNFAS